MDKAEECEKFKATMGCVAGMDVSDDMRRRGGMVSRDRPHTGNDQECRKLISRDWSGKCDCGSNSGKGGSGSNDGAGSGADVGTGTGRVVGAGVGTSLGRGVGTAVGRCVGMKTVG